MIMKKICEYCKKEFEIENKQTKYCCKHCSNLAAYNRSKLRKAPKSGKYCCKACGKEFNYIHGQKDYGTKGCVIHSYEYCCYECGVKKRSNKFRSKYTPEKIEKMLTAQRNTNCDRYGVVNPMQRKEIMEKSKNTRLVKYGDIMPKEAIEKSRKILKTKEFSEAVKNGIAKISEAKKLAMIEKRKSTLISRYGVDNVSKITSIKNKKLLTLRKNNTFITSKFEKTVLEKLKLTFLDVQTQYKSNLYPFNCDFYIPSLDLYIECQGHFSHGKHAFDASNIDDLKQLEEWKLRSKDHSAYITAINVWTIRDPLKRQTAKENNLNWIEFFSIEEFEEWYKNFK